MLQILGLRTFIKDGEEKKYDAFHDKNWRAKSVADLLQNIDEHVKQIPKSDRWNIFYTIANCGEGKREFQSQDVMAFDVDGLDTEKIDDYIRVVTTHLGLKSFETGIVFSGNGLHFLVGLKKPIRNKTYFAQNRHHYRALCAKLNAELQGANLPGKFDTTVFDARRILRLPNTENRKPDKARKFAKILNATIKPVDFHLPTYSGVPEVAPNEQIDANFLKKYSTDEKAVEEGCAFLKDCRENPEDIDEPRWYAALSIVGRFEKGREKAHEYSKGHKGYTPEQTDMKLEQALAASGPRKCDGIAGLFPGCRECPHYGKIVSPIQIVGEGHIGTEHTGFHHVFFNQKGEITKTVPAYEDLRRFYEREHPYKGFAGTKQVLAWNGHYYCHELSTTTHLQQFAQEHFKPAADNKKVAEFSKLVERTNLATVSWFDDTTKGKINFQNGVLDLDSGALSAHSIDRGFRYMLSFDYDPGAKAPLFKKMLNRITCGDEELEQVLLEYMGYCLSNDNVWAHKAAVFIGTGANGKSTLVNILRALGGETNSTSFNLNDLDGKNNEYNRVLLSKALFNISEETPVRKTMEGGLFKNLVSGGEVFARNIFKDPFFFRNRAKLLFLCNELPHTDDHTFGFYRRLIIIPFNAVFTDTDKDFDPHIEQKLLNELPGIFNMAMAAYKEVKKRKAFTKAKASADALDNYRHDSDNILAWCREKVIKTDNEADFSATADLYAAYKIYCESGGMRPLPSAKFSRRVGMFLGEDRKHMKKEEGHVIRGYKTVVFLKGNEESEDGGAKIIKLMER